MALVPGTADLLVGERFNYRFSSLTLPYSSHRSASIVCFLNPSKSANLAASMLSRPSFVARPVIGIVTTMTEFIKKVRNGLIPQPTQKSFDLPIWDDAFLRINEPTTEDIRLHETGTWIFRKRESIRRKLKPIWVKGFSKRDQLLLFVGGANRGLVRLGCSCVDAEMALSSIENSLNYLLTIRKL
jgi:hypothetical protein